MRKIRDDRDRNRYISDLHDILLLPNLHVHTRRAALYKAIQDYSENVLKNSDQQYWSSGVKEVHDNRSSPCTKRMYRFEHVVPISVITDHLVPDRGKPQEWPHEDLKKKLERVFSTLIKVCWVTRKEDGENLSGNGYKKKMPAGWNWDTGNPWDRYKKAGLKWETIPEGIQRKKP